MTLCENCKGLEAAKNAAYSERNKLVAAISKLFPASLENHEGDNWGDDWRGVVFIDLPTGQVSWHIHDSERPQFGHLSKNAGRKWDGHSTEEKYNRLAALPAAIGEIAAMGEVVEAARGCTGVVHTCPALGMRKNCLVCNIIAALSRLDAVRGKK